MLSSYTTLHSNTNAAIDTLTPVERLAPFFAERQQLLKGCKELILNAAACAHIQRNMNAERPCLCMSADLPTQAFQHSIQVQPLRS